MIESIYSCEKVRYVKTGSGFLFLYEAEIGHVKSHKQLKESLQTFIKTADETTFRLAAKIIRAVSK
ncbi:MAG: hypothetical protein MUO31_12245 [Thermodesulfovibrionales bacterium]|nr:hypothetical protein [Thermodesulfovibrionales bacterium]